MSSAVQNLMHFPAFDPRWWRGRPAASLSLTSRRRYRPKVEALEDLVVPSAVVPVPLSPASTIRTLAALDMVRATAAVSASQFNGVYRATLVGTQTTSETTQPIRGTLVLRAEAGVITANGHRVGTISANGVVRMRFTDQGLDVQINGLTTIVNGVPKMTGTWTTTGSDTSGRGTWSAIRTANLTVNLAGRWQMAGVQTNVARSNWQGDLRLYSDGTLRWMETRGANAGATRVGRWSYDGRTFKMHWWAPKVGRVEWQSNQVTRTTMSGTYRTPMAGPQPVGWGGTWSAQRIA